MEGVEFRDFHSIPGVDDYLSKLKRMPGTDGKGTNEGVYDYRYDADKFCRKVFAQDAVFDEDEHVFWIDGDCIAHQPIPEDFLKSLVILPLCYMGRRGELSYTETGFIGFNTKHEEFPKFREKYLSYFTTGKIFTQLKGWHDCIAFDYARQGINGRNLTPQGIGVGNVMIDSPLAPYMSHFKGARKFKTG